jgi:hypothetical protein
MMSRYTAPIPCAKHRRLEAAKHDRGATTSPTVAIVEPDRLVAQPAVQVAGLIAFGLERVAEPIGAIAAAAEQPMRSAHVVQHGHVLGATVCASDPFHASVAVRRSHLTSISRWFDAPKEKRADVVGVRD